MALSWAGRRRAIYLGGVVVTLLVLFSVPLFFFLYEPPTCFDGERNGDERGEDCGGSCELLCPFEISPPFVLWSRAFQVAEGVYNAAAYIEHANGAAGVRFAPYLFKLFDSSNILIAERSGTGYILPNVITPIFEASISTGARVPTRATFEFTGPLRWTRAPLGEPPYVVRNQRISNLDRAPRIDATIINTSLDDLFDVDVVGVVFDVNDNAIAASQTVIPLLEEQSSQEIVFTWPQPFPVQVERCAAPIDAVLVFDRSGSMAFGNFDLSAPQPLIDARNAALTLFDVLSSKDRAGFVTFATEATRDVPLTANLEQVQNSVRMTQIIATTTEELYEQQTNIAEGLALAREMFTGDKRAGARTAAILFTDGVPTHPEREDAPEYPNDAAREAAEALKADGVVLYTIGLGAAQIDERFLRDIASTPDHFELAETVRDLSRIYQEVSEDICEKGPAIIDVLPKTKDVLFPER